MLIRKNINLFRLFYFTILLTKSSFQLTTSLSNILHFLVFQVKTNIRFSDFQSKLELLITEKALPFRDEVLVGFIHKCSQQSELLALHLEMLGYILCHLKGFGYLRKNW